MPSFPNHLAARRARLLVISLCIVGGCAIAILPRLGRYLAWIRDPYLVVVSTPPEALANLEKQNAGTYLPADSDLAIWESVYGQEKREAYRSIYASAIRTNAFFAQFHPLNFWGLVVDQYGKPIEGAEVIFVWLNLRGGSQGWANARTGADGRVKLVNAAGPSLLVYASKEGYFQSRPAGGAQYEYSTTNANRFVPDPHNPVHLVLGKPRLGQLIPRNHKVLVMPRPDVAIGFDPESATYTTNGPLFFGYQFGPNARLASGEALLEIGVRGGGLVETEALIPWDAPEQGYVPRIIRVFPKDWDWVQPSPIIEAYCHLGNPERWGFLRIEVSGLRKNGRVPETIGLDFVISTNSSRQIDNDLVPRNINQLMSGSLPEQGVVPDLLPDLNANP